MTFRHEGPIGGNSRTKLAHSMAATAANVHNSQVLPALLHGKEAQVWGDTAYSGQREVVRQHAPATKSFIHTKAHRHQPLSEMERARNRTKSTVSGQSRTCIFGDQGVFGWAKVQYRGLAKNTHWLQGSCGLTNLYVGRRHSLAGA